MKKLIREKNYQKSKRFGFLLTFLFLILFALITLQVLFANQLVEKGKRIKNLNHQIEIIKKENQELKGLIAKETSLDIIMLKAEKQGMVKLTSVIYLSAPLSIALNQ